MCAIARQATVSMRAMLATERAADPVAPGLVEAEVELVVVASVGVVAVSVGVVAVSVGGVGTSSMVTLTGSLTMLRHGGGSECGLRVKHQNSF